MMNELQLQADAGDDFRWQLPARYNLAQVCCGRWASERARFALYYEDAAGQREAWTFWDIQREANRLSNVLAAMGVMGGDRVAILLPQRPETAIAHIACQQMGAIALPLPAAVAPKQLQYRLAHTGARVALVDPESLAALAPLREGLPELRQVIGVGGARESWVREWDKLLPLAATRYTAVDTGAEDPALITHVPGPAGRELGVVLAQRALAGALPGFIRAHGAYPVAGDMFWSPVDWGSNAGLFAALLPVWSLGQPILGYRGGVDPDRAWWLMERYGIRNTFFAPADLAAMMAAPASAKFDLALRSLVVGGGPLAEVPLAWVRENLGIEAAGLFGVAEANNIVGACPSRPGALGRPYPGHRVALFDAAGQPTPTGAVGELCVQRSRDGVPDPVIFSSYWNEPGATQARFFGTGPLAWARTGLWAKQEGGAYLQQEDGRV